jgi:hypothetical protein
MTGHVSPLDATFLELEEADESAHMHVGALLTFEPPPGDGPLRGIAASLDELRVLAGVADMDAAIV